MSFDAMEAFTNNFAALDWVIVAAYLAGSLAIGVVANQYIHAAAIWAWVYGIGFAAYAALVVVIIPLGARDLVRMFRQLRSDHDPAASQSSPSAKERQS